MKASALLSPPTTDARAQRSVETCRSCVNHSCAVQTLNLFMSPQADPITIYHEPRFSQTLATMPRLSLWLPCKLYPVDWAPSDKGMQFVIPSYSRGSGPFDVSCNIGGFFVFSSNQGIKLCCFNGFLECTGYASWCACVCMMRRLQSVSDAMQPAQLGVVRGPLLESRARPSPEQMFRVHRDFHARPRKKAEVFLLGCADEDSAYLSKRMLRVGTLDDARVSTVVNMPKG